MNCGEDRRLVEINHLMARRRYAKAAVVAGQGAGQCGGTELALL